MIKRLMQILAIVVTGLLLYDLAQITVEVFPRPITYPDPAKLQLSALERETLLQVEYIYKHKSQLFHPPLAGDYAGDTKRYKLYTDGSFTRHLIYVGVFDDSEEQIQERTALSKAEAHQISLALKKLKVDKEHYQITTEWGGAFDIMMVNGNIEIHITQAPPSLCSLSPHLICVRYWWQPTI